MKKLFLLGITVIFVLSSLSWVLVAQEGQGTGRIVGIVMDKDKNPIEGAKITLEYTQFSRKLETVSDATGKWSFLGLGKGVVQIKAEKSGYANGGIQLEVSGVKKNLEQKITLLKPEEADPNAAKNEASKDNFTRAVALFESHKYQEALDLFIKTRELQPKLYKIGINIGNSLLELQRYNEAITEFNGVLEKLNLEKADEKVNADIARVYAGIGDAYMRQNNLKEAEVNFKKAIDMNIKDHALPYMVAEILFSAGQTDDAIKYYEMAITINPAWSKSYKQAGYAYLNKGDTENAVKMFKKFLELDPEASDASAIEEVIKSL